MVKGASRNCGPERTRHRRSALSGVHDKPEALVLKAHKLADSGGDEHAARNQMCLELRHNLLRTLLICILFTGGDLTGLPMNRLVSYKKQNAAALEALDADVRVVGVGSISRWLAYRRVLAGEPLITQRWLPSVWVLNLEDFPEAVFVPRGIIVHGQIRGRERLHDHLDPVRWQGIRELKAIQAVADVAVDNRIVYVGPLVHLPNDHIAIHDALVRIEGIRWISGAQIMRVCDSWQLSRRRTRRRNARGPQGRPPTHSAARYVVHG
jgi:hypothetical protein